MQSFDELEYKKLEEHFVEYKAFTRLLLTLSVASLTIVSSTLGKVDASFLKATIPFAVLQLCSVLSGVFVQYQIMMRPIQTLRQAAASIQQGQDHSPSSQQSTGRPMKAQGKPEKIERFSRNCQIASFSLSFVALVLGLACRG